VLFRGTNGKQAGVRAGATDGRNFLPCERFPANARGICHLRFFQNRPVNCSGDGLIPCAGCPVKFIT
jgi:hypothetical protein